MEGKYDRIQASTQNTELTFVVAVLLRYNDAVCENIRRA
jgi:hypothetical protein